MRQTFYWLFVVVTIFCVSAQSAMAGQRTVYGPVDLKIRKWHVHISHHRFHVDNPGSSVIVVSKKKPYQMIRKGFLLINGKLISLCGLRKDKQIVIPLKGALRSNNYLKVFLFGQPGAALRMMVKKRCDPLPPPGVTFSSDPATILPGASATLSWETDNAETVAIDNDIGPVDASGSFVVSPVQTSTYTLTATGPGGTATAETSVTVLHPPVSSIEANPGTVHTGESSTLTWTALNADSVSIDQGVGSVEPAGSVQVFPSQTTTYTLTAVSSAGTTSIQATVTFLNTAPAAMDDAATTDENIPVTTANVLLNDSDIDRDTLIISDFSQAANGTVVSHEDGTFTYTPEYGFSGADSFSYTVNDGQGGSDTATVTVQVVPGSLSLEIISPTQGQQFTTDTITVTGRVNRASASVSVNGVAATVVGNEFTAGNVTLVPGTNTVGVQAEDGTDTSVASVTVLLDMTVDLEPIHLDIASISEIDDSLKIAGQATVTIANNGGSGVSTPYHVVLFEDINLSGGYEDAGDNRLGGTIVSSGPGAGESTNLVFEFSGQLAFRDNRMHVSVDSADEVEETDEGNNVTAIAAAGIDLSASQLRMNDTACPAEIGLTVRVGNAGDNHVAAGVPVSFYDGDPASGGALIATLTTPHPLVPGQYVDLSLQWSNPPMATAVIYARVDDDGAGNGMLPELDEENNLAYAEMALCTATETPADGMSGQVIDALTGGFLAAAIVSLHQVEDGMAGVELGQTMTNDQGGFAFSALQPGSYVLVADAQGYISGERRVAISASESLNHQDIVISPLLGPDEIRVILTWGENPADLEAHLTGPNPDGCRHHCFYWNREIPGARLDTDSTRGFGPETITISGASTGEYRYYVHDFSDRLEDSTDGLAVSGAMVHVIFGDGQNAVTFDVPAENGSVWHVFDLDGTSGTITPVNRMGFQEEPGKIDFPTIVSTPPGQIKAETPFSYTVQAIDPDTDTLLFRLLDAPAGMAIDPLSGRIDWTPMAHQTGTHPVMVSVTDPHCGEDAQGFSLHVLVDILPRPSAAFSVSPCTGFNPGGDITLSWSTSGADFIEIDNGIGQVAASGQLTLPSPEPPAAYTLNARNEAGSAARTVPGSPVTEFEICELPENGQYEFTWGTTCATDCAISPMIGPVPCSGTMEMTLTEPGTFTLVASNPAGNPAIKSAKPQNCNIPPPFSFSTQNICQWEAGDPLTITWTAAWAASARIEPDVGLVANTGTLTVMPMQPTTYTLYVTDSDGFEHSRSVDVPGFEGTVFNAYAMDPFIVQGQSTELFWAASGCVDSCMIDQGIGLVDEAGSVVVTPDQLPQTYSITAISNGLEVASRQITIRARIPTISFTASPGIIKPGDQATLRWQTTDATTCRIEPDIGTVATTGSLSVEPEKSTTYTLIAEGPGGTNTANATVVFVKPTARIQADPETILPGESAILTWVFSNADECVIEPDIGVVDLGDSVEVRPTKTTTYTLTATGPGGNASDSVTVFLPLPTVSISLNPPYPGPGEKVTLVWQTTHADGCVISPDIGSVGPQGSVEIMPVGTVTYTIHAYGPGGHATAQATVTCDVPELQLSATPPSVHAGEAVTLAWSSTGAANGWLWPDIGEVPPQGTITVYPERNTSYVLSSTGCGGEVTANASVSMMCRPQATLIEPDSIGDTVNSFYTIRWTDSDCDDDAVISLYYDADPNSEEGIPIVTGIRENPDGPLDYFTWDTSLMPAGQYYVYLVIQDSAHEPVVVRGGAVTVDHSLPVLKETRLTEDFGNPYDRDPADIDIEGDTAIVGYRGYGAYVYTLSQGEWVFQQRLDCPDENFTDQFGASVGVSGDFAVVGVVPSFSYQGEDSGAAYMFCRENNHWTFHSELTPSEAGLGLFGSRVAIDGDIAVVVSGGIETYMGTRAPGRAFVFMLENDAWVESQKLVPSDSAEYDFFGASVEIDQDAMIIGADRSYYMGNGLGSAYIFRYSDGQWHEESILSDAGTDTGYGSTVSISGNHAIVGAPSTSSDSERNIGAAYVYSQDSSASGNWQQKARLESADPADSDFFGKSVAIDGDFAIVGAYRKDVLDSSSGAACLYKLENETWTEKLELSTIDPDPPSSYYREQFGENVALDNGTLFVSSQSGAYLYEACSASIVADPPFIAPGGETTLRWQSVLASTCSIEPGLGEVEPAGNVSISPAESTAYTIHAAGEYGATVRTAHVWVGTWQPTVEIGAGSISITPGASTLLFWKTQYANTVSIEPGIGDVGLSGAVTVSPAETTDYVITAEGPGGQVTGQVTVTVAFPEPTAELLLQPALINPGESITLTWSTQNATQVSITPDVGTVTAEGAVTISPADSTTYTLTAVGPGGTAEAQATVSVNFPPPTAELNADHLTVGSGETVTLTWTSAYAHQCVIEPDVGPVDPSGSIAVTPTETTVYTLTATGPGGSATDTLTVTVIPKPQIVFSADPTTIQLGDPVTLTWEVSHADSCAIEPDVGSVTASGSVTVNPIADTVYTLTATGSGGTATGTASVSVNSPIDIQLLYPGDGAMINRPDTMVRGTFANPSGKETGITVNGKVAMVYGNEFVVNHLPLEEGSNTITIIATDVDGYVRTATATVTAAMPERYIRISANIEAANAPLETALRIDGTFSIDDSALSYAGPGTVDFLETGADAYRVGMVDEGIYYFTAEAVHDTVTYMDTIAVVVVDASALDALLQQKWTDMKVALIADNIEEALQYHHERSQERYSAIYNAIGSELPALVSQMQSISLIYCVDGTAKYRIRQDHDINGQIVTITYYVYFIHDDYGLWRIEKY
jgi:plastocyanin